MSEFKTIKVDELTVEIFGDRSALGARSARLAAIKIKELLQIQEEINIVFAAADSQVDFLEELIQLDIPWSKINAFHMDEYIGLAPQSEKTFGHFLKQLIFDRVPFKNVYLLRSDATDLEEECKRYAAQLEKNRPDFVFFGIGENTHLAFNDPHVADFNDQETVKIVNIDIRSRQQQVNEGCFTQVEEVPKMAFTLTIPTLLSVKFAFCMVPGKRKAEAVKHTLEKDISPAYPSTILRTLQNAVLFLDEESFSGIDR